MTSLGSVAVALTGGRRRRFGGRVAPRRWTVLSVLVTTLLVLGATSTLTTSPAAAETSVCPGQSINTSNPTGLVKDAHPVVLVHGWDGAPMQDTRAGLEQRLGSGWQFELFDYHSVSGHWAAHKEVAAPLAAYIHCVAQAHRHAGGDGHVFVVAHSMGGLATLYAADPASGGVPALGDDLGGVVTLDTPWTGSPWGGTPLAQLIQTLSMLSLPSATSDAWSCLRKVGRGGAGGCSAPSFLPSNVPVAQVAGQVTISRSFFGVHAYDMPTNGDLIVSTDSQQSYLNIAPGTPWGQHVGNQTVSCTKDLSAILAESATKYGRAGGWAGTIIAGLAGADVQMLIDGHMMDQLAKDQVDASVVEVAARALLTTDCSHVGMPKNPQALDAVAAQLRAEAKTPRLNLTSLKNAPIPACGGHGPARLRDGKYDASNNNPSGPSQGYASLAGRPVSVDLTGDGVSEAVTALDCNAGGVSWPQLLLAYRDGPTLLGSVDLADLTPPAEHSDVTSLTVTGSGVTVSWRTYEGCCFGFKGWSGVLRWQGSKLVMTQLTQTSGPTGHEGDPATWSVQPGQIGPFRAGITGQDAEVYGWMKLNLNPTCGQTYDMTPALQGKVDAIMGVDTSGSDVVDLLYPAAGQATDKGIRIGSSLAQMKAAYGPALQEQDSQDYWGSTWLLRGPDNGYLFFQSTNGSSVEGIQIGVSSRPQFVPEGC